MRRITIVFFLLSASLLFARTRLIIWLDTNVEFDLSLAGYPPMVFPTYYFPTLASGANPQGIDLFVGHQRIGPRHDVSTMYLATRGSGDFAPSVLLNQLYFAPDGEPLPPPGVDPPGGNWQAYSILYQQIEQFPVSGPGFRRFSRPQDFTFQADSDDEATNSTITIYYRVFGL